jgi:hypothetical protein
MVGQAMSTTPASSEAVAEAGEKAPVDVSILALEPPPYNSCRSADDDGTTLDVAGYYAARADDRAIADRNAFEYRDAGADPHVTPDTDGLVDTSIRLAKADSWLIEAMVTGNRIEAWADDRVSSERDLDAIRAKVRVRADEDSVSDVDVLVACDCRRHRVKRGSGAEAGKTRPKPRPQHPAMSGREYVVGMAPYAGHRDDAALRTQLRPTSI